MLVYCQCFSTATQCWSLRRDLQSWDGQKEINVSIRRTQGIFIRTAACAINTFPLHPKRRTFITAQTCPESCLCQTINPKMTGFNGTRWFLSSAERHCDLKQSFHKFNNSDEAINSWRPEIQRQEEELWHGMCTTAHRVKLLKKWSSHNCIGNSCLFVVSLKSSKSLK